MSVNLQIENLTRRRKKWSSKITKEHSVLYLHNTNIENENLESAI